MNLLTSICSNYSFGISSSVDFMILFSNYRASLTLFICLSRFSGIGLQTIGIGYFKLREERVSFALSKDKFYVTFRIRSKLNLGDFAVPVHAQTVNQSFTALLVEIMNKVTSGKLFLVNFLLPYKIFKGRTIRDIFENGRSLQ